MSDWQMIDDDDDDHEMQIYPLHPYGFIAAGLRALTGMIHAVGMGVQEISLEFYAAERDARRRNAIAKSRREAGFEIERMVGDQ